MGAAAAAGSSNLINIISALKFIGTRKIVGITNKDSINKLISDIEMVRLSVRL